MTQKRIGNAIMLAIATGVAIWVAMNTYWTDVPVPGTLQGDAAVNPYYSVQHLTNALGIQTRMITSLTSPPPSSGVLLIKGSQTDLQHNRVESLAPWVASGGRLVLSGELMWGNQALQNWSGIAPGSHLVKKPAGPAAARILGNGNPDCAPLTVNRDGKPTGETLIYCGPETQFEFISKRKAAWSLSNQYGVQVLRIDIGRGSLTVIPAWLIDNKNFPQRDHAQIFISAAQLSGGDRLYILDVSSAEPLTALLWRLAAPAIVFFGAAILLFIARHLRRFGPLAPAPSAVRRSLGEQIRANAAFAWRTRRLSALRAAVARALDETARRRIVSYGSWPQRRRAAALAELTGVDLGSLNAAMTGDAGGGEGGGAQVQRAAIALIEKTRRLIVRTRGQVR